MLLSRDLRPLFGMTAKDVLASSLRLSSSAYLSGHAYTNYEFRIRSSERDRTWARVKLVTLIRARSAGMSYPTQLLWRLSGPEVLQYCDFTGVAVRLL